MSNLRSAAKLAVAVILAFITACSEDNGTAPTQPAVFDPDITTATTEPERTPFQRQVIETYAQREADGFPVPTVSFQYRSDSATPLATLQQQGVKPGESVTIVATTVVHYGNPEQAGKTAWPPIVIEGSVPPDFDGIVNPGDYTQAVKDAVEAANPGFWQTYDYGQEPRTYTFTETMTFTFAEGSGSANRKEGPAPEGEMAPRREPLTPTTVDEIVTGYSLPPGPALDYTLDEALEIEGVEVASVKVGFDFDWAFGIRLPMEVGVTRPSSVLEGSSFVPTSIARGLNWSASDFTGAGLAGESGNEFVWRYNFFLGMEVKVLGACAICFGPNIDEDKSDSFTTPLAPGAVFNLPTIDIALVDETVAIANLKIGFTATPQAGSDEFAADWAASGEASGGGGVVYTTSGASKDLGSVLAIDGPGSADLTVDEFEYVFTQFKIALGLFAQVGVDAGILGSDSWRFDIPITSFDLSSIFPDVTVPLHDGSSPDHVNTSVPVVNVAPTAEIDLTHATLVNGVPAFFAETGVPHEFKGSSFDPGRDDLEALWDFGDGAPSPDVSTNYPLGGPVGPNQITDMQAHTFDEACLREATFKVVDDDGAFAEDHVTVVGTPPIGSNRARLAGYWEHQLRRNGKTDFTDAELECKLAIVGFMSAVFSEARDASTIEAAHDVLFLQRNHGSELERLDRELLVAWLNFSCGVIGFSQTIDIDNDGAVDGTLGSVMTAVESVRLDPGATAAQLQEQRRILHNINALEVGQTS